MSLKMKMKMRKSLWTTNKCKGRQSAIGGILVGRAIGPLQLVIVSFRARRGDAAPYECFANGEYRA